LPILFVVIVTIFSSSCKYFKNESIWNINKYGVAPAAGERKSMGSLFQQLSSSSSSSSSSEEEEEQEVVCINHYSISLHMTKRIINTLYVFEHNFSMSISSVDEDSSTPSFSHSWRKNMQWMKKGYAYAMNDNPMKKGYAMNHN